MVKQRKFDDDGKKIGTEHINPLIDARAYEVEFIDSNTETLTSNIISEKLLA